MSRIIDADALISDLEYDIKMDQDSLDYEDLSDVNRKLIQNDKDCKQNAVDILKSTPTVDANLVKHGHWIDATKQIGFPNWSCSICGKEGRGDYLHCCWCGAKMDVLDTNVGNKEKVTE